MDWKLPDWKPPAWETPLDQADRVEVFALSTRSPLSEKGWPESFWPHTNQRQLLLGSQAERVIDLFRGLKVKGPARCHFPPWGLAFYQADDLLFTVTLCYQCYNAYLFDSTGRDLRGFDEEGREAQELYKLLGELLSVRE